MINSVRAPIEPVVDPRLHHLNVAVAPGKCVAARRFFDGFGIAAASMFFMVVALMAAPVGRAEDRPMPERVHEIGGADSVHERVKLHLAQFAH